MMTVGNGSGEVAKEQWFAVMVVFGSVLTELVTAMAGKKEEKEKKKK